MRITRSRHPGLYPLAALPLAALLLAGLLLAGSPLAGATPAGVPIGSRAAIGYDPATRLVTLSVALPDGAGRLIGGLHPADFVVYENGVRQQPVRVRVEHAAISAGLLLEYGGRYPSLDAAAGSAVSMAAEQLVGDIEAGDRLAVWTYGNRMRQLTGFTRNHADLQSTLYLDLQAPPFSELNFYDALIEALTRLRRQPGQRALIVVSSGRDTFSRATFGQALQAARTAGVPIYFIDLTPLLQGYIADAATPNPYAALDLSRDRRRMQQIAAASGGRVYSPADMLDLSGLYDDLMQTLRVRYRVTYRSHGDAARDIARTVRVELLGSPRAAAAPRLLAAAGQPAHALLIAEASYRPEPAGAPRASLAAALGARAAGGAHLR
ncbi:MAG TPA: VWA domain-containing protein [Steroidobacteraceae bacterium]|nr:VWA domain-containing protein [Steroidobacteraceae bacterium]